eukprot:15452322-Alexandrium_andersonii.AAC.1
MSSLRGVGRGGGAKRQPSPSTPEARRQQEEVCCLTNFPKRSSRNGEPLSGEILRTAVVLKF